MILTMKARSLIKAPIFMTLRSGLGAVKHRRRTRNGPVVKSIDNQNFRSINDNGGRIYAIGKKKTMM